MLTSPFKSKFTFLLPLASILSPLSASAAEQFTPRGQIEHIVCFKFKAPVTLAQAGRPAHTYQTVQEVADAVTAYYYEQAGYIRYLTSFGGGENNSPEGFPLGYDRCFSMTFPTAAHRDYFVGMDHTKPFDIYHDNFKKFVGPAIAGDPTATPAFGGGLFVFDYQVR